MIGGSSDLLFDQERKTETETGSATVFWVVLLAGLVALTAAIAFAINVSTVRTKTQATADLAALAAANRTLEVAWDAADSVTAETTERACAAANQVVEAQSHSAAISECWTDGADVYVKVASQANVGPFTVTVNAKARAGWDIG